MGMQQLIACERGIFCLLLLVVGTLLVFLGRLSGSDWMQYTEWLAVTFVASKTITGAVETLKRPTIPQATAAAPKATP